MDDQFFSDEYVQGSKAEKVFSTDEEQKDIIPIDVSQYEISKPRRVILKARIIHD